MPQLDPNDPRVEWAVFGKEVETFLKSPIGDFLLSRSREQADEAIEKLKSIDPQDWKAIQSLQNTIKVAESFQVWLGDAVAAGHQSIAQLEEENAGT